MEANAALRAIVRRDSGEGYREMLERLAEESGIATPTAEDLIRLDRKRKGKRLSNAEWTSPTDPEARIAKLKDGRTHLAYKPEHAVDLDTGAIVAAEVHPADRGDTATLPGTLAAAEANLAAVGAAPDAEDPSRAGRRQGLPLARRAEGSRGRRLEEPHRREEGDGCQPLARRRGGPPGGVQQPRPAALGGGQGGVQAPGRAGRAELRADPRSRRHAPRLAARAARTCSKRYLVHVAGYNLGLIMRLLVGAGTPREFLARASAHLLALATADGAVLVVLVVATDTEAAMLVVSFQPEPPD